MAIVERARLALPEHGAHGVRSHPRREAPVVEHQRASRSPRLRRAFWAESRCIGHYNVILEIANEVPGLDVAALTRDLTVESQRCAVFDDLAHVTAGAVVTSPHIFLPDGTSHTNPGISVHWQGDWARGFPVIDDDDPTVYDTIVTAAAN